MRGQLWQECELCPTEPVCVQCFLCSRHCACDEISPEDEVSPEVIPTPKDTSEADVAKVMAGWVKLDEPRKLLAGLKFDEEHIKTIHGKFVWHTGESFTLVRVAGHELMLRSYGNACVYYCRPGCEQQVVTDLTGPLTTRDIQLWIEFVDQYDGPCLQKRWAEIWLAAHPERVREAELTQWPCMPNGSISNLNGVVYTWPKAICRAINPLKLHYSDRKRDLSNHDDRWYYYVDDKGTEYKANYYKTDVRLV